MTRVFSVLRKSNLCWGLECGVTLTGAVVLSLFFTLITPLMKELSGGSLFSQAATAKPFSVSNVDHQLSLFFWESHPCACLLACVCACVHKCVRKCAREGNKRAS